MGTDRVDLEPIPCPCRKGIIRITKLSPDNPWSRFREDWRGSIDCPACKQLYRLVDRELNIDYGEIYLTETENVQRREEAEKEYWNQRKKLMGSSTARRLLRNYIDRVLALPSVAAQYRELTALRIAHQGEKSFRKTIGIKGAERYIMESTGPNELLAIMKTMGIEDEEVRKKIENIERLWKTMHETFPLVGEPLAKFKR